MIEPTDEMRAAVKRRMGVPDGHEMDPWMGAAIEDVLAIVERDFYVRPRPTPLPPKRREHPPWTAGAPHLPGCPCVHCATARPTEPEQLCGAVYVDPRGGERPPQDPCGKTRGHENGPETDWKRGYHSNGQLKWLVEP